MKFSGDIELMKSKQPVISSQCKLRRLWRPAVATQPPIASAHRRLLCQLVRGYSQLMLDRSWVRGYGETP